MADTITVCPDCGGCEIRCRSARCIETNAAGARYHCADCEARFDEPATRPRESGHNTAPGTAARALADADPEVIGEGSVLACPECDDSDIRRTGSDTARGTNHNGVWHCEACGERFTSPLRRPPRDSTGSHRNGLARTLETTDADDLIPDGGDLPAACPVCEAAIDGDADRPYQCDCGHLFYELSVDGGGARECHACGAETEADRYHECRAVPWTDHPLDPDAALARASRLRNAADRLETQAATDGGTAEHPEWGMPAPVCGVDGCRETAVARLFGHAVARQGGPRCRDCLLLDLGVEA
jgi:ribosomal protein L37AE/L43A